MTGEIRVISSNPCDVIKIVRKRRDPSDVDAVIEVNANPLSGIFVAYTEKGVGGFTFGRTSIIIGNREYDVVGRRVDSDPRIVTFVTEDEGAKRPVVEITVRPLTE